MEVRPTPHEIPWQLWGICFLTMLSPDMGTSHGQPGHLIFQHAISFSGGIWNLVLKAPAPHAVRELKHRIQQEVKRIPVEMLQRVMGDVCKRLTECLEGSRGHLNGVIFGKEDFCFQGVKLNLNSFIYTLCSYVSKLNKWKHLLFTTFLKSPDSLMHPV